MGRIMIGGDAAHIGRLAVPSGIDVAISDQGVAISWEEVDHPDVDGYFLNIRSTGTDGSPLFDAGGRNPLTLPGQTGATYMVRARTYRTNNIGVPVALSPWSGFATGRVAGDLAPPPPPSDLQPPSAVTNLTATPSTTQRGRIALAWGAAARAASYDVEQAASSSGPWSSAGSAQGTSLTFAGTPGTTYYFRVKGTNSAGSGDYSNIASATAPTGGTVVVDPPATPTGLTATTGTTSGQILVSWGASTRATSYRLGIRLTSSDTWSYITRTQRSYTFTGTPGESYTFSVQARGAGGDSAFSSSVSAFAYQAAPGQVTAEAAPGSATGSVRVTWTAVARAVDYEVQSSTAATGPWTSQGTTTSGFHDYTGTAGTTYYFRVRARGAGGFGPWSAVVSAAATRMAAPPPPSHSYTLSVTSSGRANTLTWSPPFPGRTQLEIQFRRGTSGGWQGQRQGATELRTSRRVFASLPVGEVWQYRLRASIPGVPGNFNVVSNTVTVTVAA